MSLKVQIEADIRKAMLARNRDELIALRGIKAAILIAETEKGASGELTPEVDLKVLVRAAKQRKESMETYSEKGRQDLADKEQAEWTIINRYLPKKMSLEELGKMVSEIITSEGATGMQDMGKIMGIASKKLAGRAEGKEIAEAVKKRLSGS